MLRTPTNPLISDLIYQIKSHHFKSADGKTHLLPDNYAELLLNTGAPIKRKIIGSFRSLKIATGEMVLTSCRSKGIVLESEHLAYISVKIQPEYTQLLFGEGITLDRDLCVLMEHRGPATNKELILQVRKILKGPPGFAPDPVVEMAVQMIRGSNGEIKINEILAQLNVSKSFLEQRFYQYIGLTPKEFCKVEKMKTFISYYHRYQETMNLTQLTFMSGYYDQSHLIKDFKYFMDSKPREFIKTHGLAY